MKSSLISVILVPQKPSTHKQITKKVVPTMTILKLKGLIQRVFHENNPPATVTAMSSRVIDYKIFFVLHHIYAMHVIFLNLNKFCLFKKKNPGITFLLDEDFTDISTYSIEEGDKLLIVW